MKKTELAVRLTNACTCVSEAEDILTEIDSKFGDADHGLTMTKIAKAISQAVAEADGGIQSMLDAAAMAVMMLNGGSAVPLWNTWLDGMQEAAPASDEVDVAGLKAMFAGAFTALDEMSGAKVPEFRRPRGIRGFARRPLRADRVGMDAPGQYGDLPRPNPGQQYRNALPAGQRGRREGASAGCRKPYADAQGGQMTLPPRGGRLLPRAAFPCGTAACTGRFLPIT